MKIYKTEKLLNENIRQVLDEMARVGNLDDKLEIYIRTNDSGNIPHMHIWDSATLGQKFHTCIRLDKPEYFHHTGKEDVLNSKQKKDLTRFLSSKHRRFNMTNWEVILIYWNDNNSKVTIDEDSEMPDYTLL